MVVIDMTDINPEVLQRYAVGNCTAEERQLVEDWLENDDPLPESHTQYDTSLKREIWTGLTDKEAKTRSNFRVRTYITIISAAAILVLLSLVFLFNTNSTQNLMQEELQQETYIAPAGKTVTMKLSEGTIVQLAGGSKFSYPAHFSGQTRTVTLISGEAFFKVKHDKKLPFIVQSSETEIKVLGTRFNLSNIAGRAKLAVTLTEGRISFKGKGEQETILKPGQQLIFNKKLNKIQSVTEVDTLYATGWTAGLLWFNQTPVTEILEKLEASYGVTFELKGHPDLNIHLTGKFRQQPLSRILKLIENSSDLRFDQQPDKKIIIYKAN